MKVPPALPELPVDGSEDDARGRESGLIGGEFVFGGEGAVSGRWLDLYLRGLEGLSVFGAAIHERNESTELEVVRRGPGVGAEDGSCMVEMKTRKQCICNHSSKGKKARLFGRWREHACTERSLQVLVFRGSSELEMMSMCGVGEKTKW